MLEALGYSLIAGLLTGAGALPLIFIKDISHKWKDSLIGFASGVMVAVSFLALLSEALEIGGPFQIIFGLTFGFLIIGTIERFVPHFEIGEIGFDTIKVKRRMVLIASAIALHNVPEGFAVGVSFGSEVPGLGLLIVIAIAVHNAPEGLVVAAPLKELGYPNWKIFLITAATGLTMPFGTAIGFILVSWADAVLVFGLSFAAGAMLYVVSHELLPESHSHGYKKQATMGFLVGIILTIIMDFYL
jgi:ZIP family zinc transporter